MDIEKKVADWLVLKRAEDKLKGERQSLALEIAAGLSHPDEGSKTHAVGTYRVTVKGTINRRVDWDAFDRVAERRPDLHAPFTIRRELDDRGVRWLMEHAPDVWAEYSEAITSQPGQPQITVKEENHDR